MASQTSALPDGSTLTKPAYTDSADIAVINTNMDKIVSNINTENQAINSLYTSYPSLRNVDHTRPIEANSDLDNYYSPGVWVCRNTDISSTVLHKPDAINGNFKLIVNINTGNENGQGNWWGSQIIISGERVYIRKHSDAEYGEWFAISTSAQYDDILSSISWDALAIRAGSSYFRRSGRFVDMCIVSDGTVSISNSATLGTITATSYRPWKFIATQIFNYSSGKPINGSAWIDPTNGQIKYYGDAITNTTIIFHITYMI